jgi:dimethylaniline monooxygenase (N-oxide forming)
MADRRHFEQFDPTWNYIPLVALVYAMPLALLSGALRAGWLGASRDFWVPLLVLLVVFARHMGLEQGLPWVATDFQHRPRPQPTLVLAYALFWVAAVRVTPHVAIAVLVFIAAAVVYDLLLIRNDILLVFAKGLPSLAVWTAAGVLFGLTHRFGSDHPAAIGVTIAGAYAVAALLLRRGWWDSRPQRISNVRTVAVIGGGWSGIYATKWLAQLGLEPVCFEESDTIGGVWRFRNDRPGGVFRDTIATSSKHFLHASDLPFENVPDFPHHSQVYAFLNRYVDHFGIRERFRLGSHVDRVTRNANGWTVASDGGQEAFDAIVIASGPYQRPRLDEATYEGFTGRLRHSSEYKDASDIEPGEVVVVVGGGESASDIAAECAARGARVHWSIYRGQWFADRLVGVYPADHLFAFGMRAFGGRFGNLEYVMRSIVARLISRRWGLGGHGVAGWAPEVPNLHQFLNKSRNAMAAIQSGAIRPVRGVASVSGRTVTFDDGVSIEADHVILGTGFEAQWPFLDGPPPRLFRKVFSVDDATLAFVGFARPVLGSIPSLSELQSRWIAHVWTGRAPLPSQTRCAQAAVYDEKVQRRWFLDRTPMGVLTDQEVYATDLATRAGADVRWFRHLFRNPRLFALLLLVPWAAFKYQLNDPDPEKRTAAVRAIRTLVPERDHPIQKFKYWVGLVLLLPVTTVAVLAWLLPVSYVPAVAGALMLAGTAALRWTEIRPRRVEPAK